MCHSKINADLMVLSIYEKKISLNGSDVLHTKTFNQHRNFKRNFDSRRLLEPRSQNNKIWIRFKAF